MRNSPLTRTPPKNLPMIPGVTCEKEKHGRVANGQKQVTKPTEAPTIEVEKGIITIIKHHSEMFLINVSVCISVEDKKQEEPQFEMDI